MTAQEAATQVASEEMQAAREEMQRIMGRRLERLAGRLQAPRAAQGPKESTQGPLHKGLEKRPGRLH